MIVGEERGDATPYNAGLHEQRGSPEYLPIMLNGAVVTVATDGGMLALWRGSAFADVDGYEAWEERVNERLAEAIQSGSWSPLASEVTEHSACASRWPPTPRQSASSATPL